MTIGERIKKVRVRFNLNQTDFGSRISVAQTYLSQIEKGDREATDKIIRLICLQFSVSEDWLRTGEGDMLVRTDSGVFDAFVRENGLDETDAAIMRVYVSLPPASRAVLHDVILWRPPKASTTAPRASFPKSWKNMPAPRARKKRNKTPA